MPGSYRGHTQQGVGTVTPGSRRRDAQWGVKTRCLVPIVDVHSRIRPRAGCPWVPAPPSGSIWHWCGLGELGTAPAHAGFGCGDPEVMVVWGGWGAGCQSLALGFAVDPHGSELWVPAPGALPCPTTGGALSSVSTGVPRGVGTQSSSPKIQGGFSTLDQRLQRAGCCLSVPGGAVCARRGDASPIRGGCSPPIWVLSPLAIGQRPQRTAPSPAATAPGGDSPCRGTFGCPHDGSGGDLLPPQPPSGAVSARLPGILGVQPLAPAPPLPAAPPWSPALPPAGHGRCGAVPTPSPTDPHGNGPGGGWQGHGGGHFAEVTGVPDPAGG